MMGEGSPSLSKSSDNIDDTRGKANLEGEGGKGKGSQGGLQVELSSVTLSRSFDEPVQLA